MKRTSDGFGPLSLWERAGAKGSQTNAHPASLYAPAHPLIRPLTRPPSPRVIRICTPALITLLLNACTLASVNTPPDNRDPWTALPRVDGPPVLIEADASIDDLFEMPAGSALTLARIDPDSGDLVTIRWRDTGTLGFYPASTIKWITAAMALEMMDTHEMTLDTVIQVGDDPPGSMRDLLASMIVMSNNDAFNTLQEAVGFGETYQQMLAWGCTDSMIRRHFTRPHWNHSRRMKIDQHGTPVKILPARPAADIPLNGDPNPNGNPESNWFTTDDFIRCGAATLMGPTRERTYFPEVAGWLSYTNQCFVRDGLNRVTAEHPDRPAYVILNKPGWWPGDGANVDLAYIHDVQRNNDYLLAIYYQGTLKEAKTGITQAAFALFDAIHTGRLELIPAD